MDHYQSFPGKSGAADSAGKLAGLLLPPLAGKSFLDVGCNEGYFCGYAQFDAASRIVGIDRDESFLNLARQKFPGCDFRLGDWENLDSVLSPDDKFDVILLASAIHYAKDQAGLIKKLMQRLNPDGVLVLEMGVVENGEGISAKPVAPGWHEIKRSIDSCIFPDWKGLEDLLAPYAYKHMGKSVAQLGDPVGRHVFHLKGLKPTAILMTGDPGSGKSTLAKKLGKIFKTIHGDVLLCKLNQEPGMERLQSLAGEVNPQRIDLAMLKICSNGGLEEFARHVAIKAGGSDFVYDGFIPAQFIFQFGKFIEKEGYYVVTLSTPQPPASLKDQASRSRIETRKYQMFLSAYEFMRKRRDKSRQIFSFANGKLMKN